MNSNSEDLLTLSKLKVKVDATRSMLNRHLTGAAISPEIWSDSDEASGDEARCEVKKERMKLMIEGMDFRDMETLDGFADEVNAQISAIMDRDSIELEQLEPKLDEVSETGETPLVGSVDFLQVEASNEESGEDNRTYELEIASPIHEEKGVLNEAPREGLGLAKIAKESDKVEYTPSARQNAKEDFQNSVHSQSELNIPNELFEEIRAKEGEKPICVATKPNEARLIKELQQPIKLQGSEFISSVKTTEAKSYMSAVTNEIAFVPSGRSEMELSFVPFNFTSGTPRIQLTPDEKVVANWKNCLVGHFVCGRMPYLAVINEMFKMWGKLGLQRMTSTASGFFFFEFSSDDTRTQILENGLCYVFGKLLVLKKWHIMLSLTREDMSNIPVWVRLHNLPYEFWSPENLSKVASILGRPLYADQATEKFLRVSYARICVEIDVSKELFKFIEVEFGGKCIVVTVEYQGVPMKCTECRVFGQDLESCPVKILPNEHAKPMFYQQKNNIRPFERNRQQHHQWRATEKSVHQNGLTNPIIINPEVQKFRKVLVDKRGKKTLLKDIKKYIKVGNEGPHLKTGNSYDVIASLDEENDVDIEGKNKKSERVFRANSGVKESSIKTSQGMEKEERIKAGSEIKKTRVVEKDNSVDTREDECKVANEMGTTQEVIDHLHAIQKADFEEDVVEGRANPDVDKNLFDAFQTTCTPTKQSGLSYSDYPSTMAKKQIKKRISAIKKANASKKQMKEPP